MAQKILLVDDIDNDSEASETLTFGLDGVDFEIDLNEAHAGELRTAVGKFTQYARRVTKGGKSKVSTAKQLTSPAAPAKDSAAKNGTAHSKHSAREIRDWARTNGIDVPDKGRVPNEVTALFEAAH